MGTVATWMGAAVNCVWRCVRPGNSRTTALQQSSRWRSSFLKWPSQGARQGEESRLWGPSSKGFRFGGMRLRRGVRMSPSFRTSGWNGGAGAKSRGMGGSSPSAGGKKTPTRQRRVEATRQRGADGRSNGDSKWCSPVQDATSVEQGPTTERRPRVLLGGRVVDSATSAIPCCRVIWMFFCATLSVDVEKKENLQRLASAGGDGKVGGGRRFLDVILGAGATIEGEQRAWSTICTVNTINHWCISTAKPSTQCWKQSKQETDTVLL